MNDKFNTIERSLQDLGDRADRAEFSLNKVQQLEAKVAELEKKIAALSAAQPTTNAVAITGANGASSGSSNSVDKSIAMTAEESEASQVAYKKGFDQLMAGKYSEAGTSFKSFIEKYPKSDQLSNAYYWLGETYYINRKFDLAAKAYEQSAELKGSKEGDALLKQGQCLIELNQKKKAQEILEHVAQEYSDSNAGKQAEKALAGLKAKK